MNFDKGDIVIMQNANYHTWFNGAFGIVVEPLERRTGLDLSTGKRSESLCYKVKVLAEEGYVVQADVHQIRKMPPFDYYSEYESELDWLFEERMKGNFPVSDR